MESFADQTYRIKFFKTKLMVWYGREPDHFALRKFNISIRFSVSMLLNFPLESMAFSIHVII